jgi:hypothetical protein
MNREEKEAVFALVIAVAGLAAMCILSFETCVVAAVFAVAASLWAYTWGLFAKLLQEASERQRSND